MAPRKPTSKPKRAPSPPAAKQQVHTASGRERQPTEKENYRFSESQHVVHRQEIKETRTAKQKKKALKAAYQGHPDVFEKEPSELLSDMDRQEDTMFSDHSVDTRLSNTNSLTFSTGKIPPRLRNSSIPTTKGPKAPHNVDESTDNNDDDAADDADDDDDEQLPAARGTKRSFDDMSYEDTMVPKVKKNADGSRRRMKASDFDEILKEILITACSVYRCLIVTQAPFPDSIAAETKLAKEAWHEACQLKGVDVKLTPSVVNMLLKRASHVRGELKTKMRPLTASFHGFRSSNSMEVIRSNQDLAERLKIGSIFVFKDPSSKSGIYKTELLQQGINSMWFLNRSDEGVVYHKYFDPIPIKTIVLVLTAIECCVDEWSQGIKEDIKFTSAGYGTVYNHHFSSLQRFDERTAPYKLLSKIRINLHDTARFHAGVASLIPLSATSQAHIDDAAFEDAIREYQREGKDAAVEDEVEEYEYPSSEGGDDE
ncbi:hypothetical protein DFJ58DRAFT_835980 [Suillus subalutaceus]|uniref:uncharacterized protein n=1 Tax=Suillus subalutaceus TaxID=48586 RepID=UPI001B8789CB|nr:uncharacterized protein DFJ58DRAFT_835980 [Suillus subalutaceus]KAG1876695.1 hypothetical protein DFJ58DRAFT_835980 [Suillus subalutaceus]